MMKQMRSLAVYNNKGFSLVEMVITIGVIATIVVALATMGIFSLKKASEGFYKSKALRYAQEGVEAIRYYRDTNPTAFGNLAKSTDTGVGNYIAEFEPTGWVIKQPEEDAGCQDPEQSLTNNNSAMIETACNSVLTPFYKRIITVENTGDIVDFRVTVWWEDGDYKGTGGDPSKVIVIGTKLSK